MYFVWKIIETYTLFRLMVGVPLQRIFGLFVIVTSSGVYFLALRDGDRKLSRDLLIGFFVGLSNTPSN